MQFMSEKCLSETLGKKIKKEKAPQSGKEGIQYMTSQSIVY